MKNKKRIKINISTIEKGKDDKYYTIRVFDNETEVFRRTDISDYKSAMQIADKFLNTDIWDEDFKKCF
jgi:hypothetical protein